MEVGERGVRTSVGQCPGCVLGESRMSVGAEESSSPHRYMCAVRVRESASRTELRKSASQSERVLLRDTSLTVLYLESRQKECVWCEVAMI